MTRRDETSLRSNDADRRAHEEMNFHYPDGRENFLVQPYAEAVVSGMLL